MKSLFHTCISVFTWFAWITTSDIRGAGTDANVYLVVYGNKGKSDVVKLDNQSDNFEAGEMDKFKIELSEIGRPYKLRVGHDNSGSFAGWHLDKVSNNACNLTKLLNMA